MKATKNALTAQSHAATRLIDLLPPVRGHYAAQTPLARTTWFRVGGKSEVMFWPDDVEDLAYFLATRPADVPVMAIGVGSNLLVRDGGVPGVIVKLGRRFATVTVESCCRLHCGAAALNVTVAAVAGMAGVGGLEFLSCIPGTIGGALRMNAGAYGAELRDVLVESEAIDGRGQRHRVGPTAFSYRYAAVERDWVFTWAVLEGRRDNPSAIAARTVTMRRHRQESQPLRTRTCGSTFKNPKGVRAWELIDNAGCRGLQMGGAMISRKHCNFLINIGGATAADLEALGEKVRRRVWETSGILLEWEICRIGLPVRETQS